MQIILVDSYDKEVVQFPPQWDGAHPDYIVFKGTIYEEIPGAVFGGDIRYRQAIWQHVVHVYQPEE